MSCSNNNNSNEKNGGSGGVGVGGGGLIHGDGHGSGGGGGGGGGGGSGGRGGGGSSGCGGGGGSHGHGGGCGRGGRSGCGGGGGGGRGGSGGRGGGCGGGGGSGHGSGGRGSSSSSSGRHGSSSSGHRKCSGGVDKSGGSDSCGGLGLENGGGIGKGGGDINEEIKSDVVGDGDGKIITNVAVGSHGSKGSGCASGDGMEDRGVKRGRPKKPKQFKCMELLQMDLSQNKMEGKVKGSDINKVMMLWNYQDKDMQLTKTGRMDKRRTHFCTTQNFEILNKATSLNDSYPTVENLANTKTIYIPVHLGKHWACVSVHLDLPHRKMIYYDSEKYSSGLRNITREQRDKRITKQLEMLEKLFNKHLEDMMILKEYTKEQMKNASVPFRKITDTTKLPKQGDDESCGVFLLFTMDCMRRGYEIKTELTTDEVLSYRVKIYEYIKSADELGFYLQKSFVKEKKIEIE
jgi:hypothetical protein